MILDLSYNKKSHILHHLQLIKHLHCHDQYQVEFHEVKLHLKQLNFKVGPKEKILLICNFFKLTI